MDKKITRHLQQIRENSVDLISEQELVDKLKSSFKEKKPLKLKIGFDPTAKDIHLGHTVLLKKLRKLQDLGHVVYLIIGDFTAKIGDPSGKNILRPVLTDKEIAANAATYTEQAFKILAKSKTQVIYNSIWYKNLKLSQFLSLLSSYTVARMLERDDFSQRMKENQPLTMREFIYPLVQGYDSFKIEADIEFGGTDQKFNLLVGRRLQEALGQAPQAVVTMPLLVGLDGKNKMSKSLGNYIGITDDPKSMFGKLMSISDEAMWEYFRLLTDYAAGEFKQKHPKEAKLALAQGLVSFYHSPAAAQREREEFERVFSQKEAPQDMPVVKANKSYVNVVDLIYEQKLAHSKNEARRLLAQGAVTRIDISSSQTVPLKDYSLEVPLGGIILKVGKKKFLKIVL